MTDFLTHRDRAEVLSRGVLLGDGGAIPHGAAAQIRAAPAPPAEWRKNGHASRRRLRLVSASSVRTERVAFAWSDRVPLGMLTLLVGQGGLGKSTLLAYIAAHASRGTLEGDLVGRVSDVVIASSEDHRAAVIVPRLLAAGADLSRVHFIESDAHGGPTDIELDGTVTEVERLLKQTDARLVLIDTLTSHIPSRFDTYKEQHVRGVLTPYAHMAERLNLSLVATMHLNRREARDVLSRISGSGGFGNLARSVLLLATDPEDPDSPTRMLAHGKSNLGPKAPTLRLRIEDAAVTADGGESRTSRMTVIGEVRDVTAQALLGEPLSEDERSALADAVDWLQGLLTGRSVPAVDVRRQARQEGHSDATVRRAAKRLGVLHRKTGMDGGWMWELPAEGGHEGSKVFTAKV